MIVRARLNFKVSGRIDIQFTSIDFDIKTCLKAGCQANIGASWKLDLVKLLGVAKLCKKSIIIRRNYSEGKI